MPHSRHRGFAQRIVRLPRYSDDSGAVLIEFALFVPVLVMLILGTMEFGFLYQDIQTIEAANRTAGRTVVNTVGGGGNSSEADHTALVAFVTVLDDLVQDGTVERVVIYDAESTGSVQNTSVEGRVPPVCLTTGIPVSGTTGISGRCNIYGGDWLRDTFDTASVSQFDDGSGACGTGVDASYCPENRPIESFSSSGAIVGVHAELNIEGFTGIFLGSYSIDDFVVHRNEPE